MTLKLATDVTAVSGEPVSRAEARSWARMDSAVEDWQVDMLIAGARARAEHITGRVFTTKTWDLWLDAFPASEVSLERTPVDSVTWVKYLDSTGAQQTIGSSSYVLDGMNEPAFLLPAHGYDWPSTYDSANAVNVRFVEGYGSNPNGWLALVRQFMCVCIATDNEFRQAMVAGIPVQELPGSYHERLLDPLRIWGV